jgi:hypothetical protein
MRLPPGAFTAGWQVIRRHIGPATVNAAWPFREPQSDVGAHTGPDGAGAAPLAPEEPINLCRIRRRLGIRILGHPIMPK